MALYSDKPVLTTTDTSTAGSGATNTNQRVLLYNNTDSLIIQNTSSTKFVYYRLHPWDNTAPITDFLPINLDQTNSGMIAPSNVLSIGIGTSTQRPGGGSLGVDAPLYLWWGSEDVGQVIRVTQLVTSGI